MTACKLTIRRSDSSFAGRAPAGRRFAGSAGQWILFAAMLTVAADSAGQIAKDPMRPPGQFLQEMPPDAASPATLVLQSVKISRSERTAIISGRLVRQGDAVGSATVVRILDGEVVLKEGDAERVLKLYPEVEKRAADTRTGARGAAPGPARSARSGAAGGGGKR